MKSRHECHKKSLRGMGVAAVIILGILSAVGSGSGGGGFDSGGGTPSGSTPSSIKAFNFDGSNTVTAAQLAANAMSFFSNFTDLGQEVIDMLLTSDPNNSPFDLTTGCQNPGDNPDAKLIWTDNGDGIISVGDKATLQFTNCDLDGSGATGTGTVDFVVTGVDPDPLPNSVGLDVSVNVTFNDSPDIIKYTATFGVMSSTPNNADVTVVYTADDTKGHNLTVTKNGVTRFKFACFNVTKAYNVGTNPGTYALSANGVINASDSIFSLVGGPPPQMSFVSDWMESGTKRLESLSSPACATAGAPNGVGDSDGSYINMEAQGGGMVRLHTFDVANVEFFTTDTIWNDLLN